MIWELFLTKSYCGLMSSLCGVYMCLLCLRYKFVIGLCMFWIVFYKFYVGLISFILVLYRFPIGIYMCVMGFTMFFAGFPMCFPTNGSWPGGFARQSLARLHHQQFRGYLCDSGPGSQGNVDRNDAKGTVREFD